MGTMKDLIRDGNHNVEHHSYLDVRPNFRIVELHISPTQEVPWHYHNNVKDTIYVLKGSIRIELNHPKF
jgi:quercetin dioxygenase-like cupin family protein